MTNRLGQLLIAIALCATTAAAADSYPSTAETAPGDFKIVDPPQPLPQGYTMAPGPIAAFQQQTVAAPVTPAPTYPSAPATSLPACEKIVESTIYTRVDYFHWNERVSGGDLLNEDGPLITLGYQHRSGIERFRAELFGSQVHYASTIDFGNGDVEPLSSHTDYLGVRGEYELIYHPEIFSNVDFFGGLGTRFWIRNLPDDFTASGNFVQGYVETWWTIYPYLGLETRRKLHGDTELYGMGRLGVTAITFEHATLDDIVLYPRPGVTGQLEGGVRGEHLFLSAFFEGMSWQHSSVVRGFLQPTSTMFTVGLKSGVNF
jgi:hypothetical protein